MNITELLTLTVQNNASDLHLSAGLPPMIRVNGELKRLDLPAYDQKKIITLIHSVMNDKQRREYEEDFELDLSFEVPDLARFRVNVFNQSRGGAAVFRTIPEKIKTLAELDMPEIFNNICTYNQGLVLVTGPTGSGKSTTLAAMVDEINKLQEKHIVTIEDPIEFIHHSKKSLINQREVRRDTLSFNTALRSILREDPDVILVGEMRDLETIRLALTAAETGHLVFATLHTNSAARTINRIIDVFSPAEKEMVRSMLSETLQAVICQHLIKRVEGGRVAALEIMICTHAIRNLIREDKVAQMYSTIQTGLSSGMQTLDQHLKVLVEEGIIDRNKGREVAINKTNFEE